MDEAVDLANCHTPMDLGAAVWSKRNGKKIAVSVAVWNGFY
jgi:hypothetical protein